LVDVVDLSDLCRSFASLRVLPGVRELTARGAPRPSVSIVSRETNFPAMSEWDVRPAEPVRVRRALPPGIRPWPQRKFARNESGRILSLPAR